MTLRNCLIVLYCFIIVFVFGDNDYSNQDSWPGICVTGKHQSPVDLKPTNLGEPVFGPGYGKEQDAILFNRKRWISIEMESPELDVEGICENCTGKLVLANFHWPSQHTINENPFDLEMEVVYINKKYPKYETTVPDGAIIISTLFKISAKPNPGFDPILKDISKVANITSRSQSETPITGVVLNNLFPTDRSYFSYYGSIPYDSCEENTQWLVFSEQATISREQFYKLTDITDKNGLVVVSNNRNIQKLNGRKITYTNLKKELKTYHEGHN